jgi:hypothetical protein
LAVTLFGPPIVNDVGLAAPLKSPVQPEKLYPAPALADIGTLCPLLYQFTPDGLTVPPPDGATEVVKLYWAVKFAVYVVFDGGTVTV